jgi:predicted ATP-grasp superfamily ATP-dependent carboligase
MDAEQKLNHPWLVAVWPGMGHVAISAGYYLMSKLDMHLFAEFSAEELFDVEHIEVKEGLILPARLPRSRFFLWTDPQQKHDIVVFIGEAQPPDGKRAFCRRLIEFAQHLGVERVITFAAMATQMHPSHDARVFAAATSASELRELESLGATALSEGMISGLNGVLLSAAAERQIPGATLLGEMPHVFAQLPFPKASLAVLRVFVALAKLELDFGELSQQAAAVEEKMGALLAQIEWSLSGEVEEEESWKVGTPEEPEAEEVSSGDRQRIEQLFEAARHDRARAFELKSELDRFGVFAEYEDRFLDLFKKPE